MFLAIIKSHTNYTPDRWHFIKGFTFAEIVDQLVPESRSAVIDHNEQKATLHVEYRGERGCWTTGELEIKKFC